MGEDGPKFWARDEDDAKLYCKKIGWSPKIDWISGLEETIKWYLDNINYLKVDSKKSYSGERLGKTK